MMAHVNGMDIFYEKLGAGRPLIMLHGNGETHDIFDRAAEVLAKRFEVYLPDTRGHGRSGAVTEYHYADMAGDVRGLIEELALEKPVVYGFSDGGIVALLLAIEHPELLSALIVSGANLCPEGIRGFWLNLFKRLYKKTGDEKVRLMLNEPNITPETLNKITVPTTVLAGGHDMIRRAHTRQIAAAIPNARLKILPVYGHGSYIVHRRKIAKLILEAVK